MDKFEPNDINRSKIINFDIISNESKSEIMKIYAEFRDSAIFGNEDISLIDKLNSIYLRIDFILTKVVPKTFAHMDKCISIDKYNINTYYK